MQTEKLVTAAATLEPLLETITRREALIAHLASSATDWRSDTPIRDAFEMLECALVLRLQRADHRGHSPFAALIDLCRSLPTHTVRSELQVSRQQFSTPAPLALFAQLRAQISQSDAAPERRDLRS